MLSSLSVTMGTVLLNSVPPGTSGLCLCLSRSSLSLALFSRGRLLGSLLGGFLGSFLGGLLSSFLGDLLSSLLGGRGLGFLDGSSLLSSSFFGSSFFSSSSFSLGLGTRGFCSGGSAI